MKIPANDECLCFHVRMASRLITNVYDDYLKPANILSGQFTILQALMNHGDSCGTDLSRRLGMDRTTLSRNMVPMIKKGLVEIVANGSDKRTKLYHITEKGVETFKEALVLWKHIQDKFGNFFEGGENPLFAIKDDISSLSNLAISFLPLQKQHERTWN